MDEVDVIVRHAVHKYARPKPYCPLRRFLLDVLYCHKPFHHIVSHRSKANKRVLVQRVVCKRGACRSLSYMACVAFTMRASATLQSFFAPSFLEDKPNSIRIDRILLSSLVWIGTNQQRNTENKIQEHLYY